MPTAGPGGLSLEQASWRKDPSSGKRGRGPAWATGPLRAECEPEWSLAPTRLSPTPLPLSHAMAPLCSHQGQMSPGHSGLTTPPTSLFKQPTVQGCSLQEFLGHQAFLNPMPWLECLSGWGAHSPRKKVPLPCLAVMIRRMGRCSPGDQPLQNTSPGSGVPRHHPGLPQPVSWLKERGRASSPAPRPPGGDLVSEPRAGQGLAALLCPRPCLLSLLPPLPPQSACLPLSVPSSPGRSRQHRQKARGRLWAHAQTWCKPCSPRLPGTDWETRRWGPWGQPEPPLRRPLLGAAARLQGGLPLAVVSPALTPRQAPGAAGKEIKEQGQGQGPTGTDSSGSEALPGHTALPGQCPCMFLLGTE